MNSFSLLSFGALTSLLIYLALRAVFVSIPKKRKSITEECEENISREKSNMGDAVNNCGSPPTTSIQDLLSVWPWSHRMNPHYAEIKQETADWIASFQPVSTKVQDALDRDTFVLRACLGYPTASKETARAGCDLMHLSLMIEECSAKNVPGEISKLKDAVLDAFRNPHSPRPNGECICGEMARQFWGRNFQNAPYISQARFIKSMDEYLEGIVQRSIDDQQFQTIGVERYIDVRRRTVCAEPMFSMIELGILGFGIPDEVMSQPAIQGMILAAIEMTSLCSDILSHNFEQTRHDGDSLLDIITCVMHEHDTDVTGAILWVEDHVVGLGDKFLSALGSLPRWEEPLNSHVKEYCSALVQWVRANNLRVFEGERWIGNKIHQIGKNRWATLPSRKLGETNNIFSSVTTPSLKWSVEQESVLLKPYTYVASSPGKGFRNLLVQALNHWLRIPSAQLDAITNVVELLHNASLLIDDIEDNSELRRGKPVAHRIFGLPQTINSANYVYFLAYEKVIMITCPNQVGNPSDFSHRLVQILNEEMLALHRGQGSELFWRDHLQCPTEEEYIQMVKGKTGGLLRVAVRLMMECTSVNTDVGYIPLVDLLSIWFQIRDDYMNLRNDTYADLKGFAEDLTEGKFSFPIIHGVRAKPDSGYILNILQQKPKDPTLKLDAISYLKDVTYSFEYTLGVLSSLEAQARGEVTRLGGNPKLEPILDMLSSLNK